MAPKRLARRKGTTDHGSSYEQKIAALLGVKGALHEDVEDMWIATNIEGLGAFDDLVLFLQKKSGSKEVYLIQIKYKKNRNINVSSSDNDLQKYQTSFLKIKEDFSNCTSPLIDCCAFQDTKFLLFTNTQIHASNNVTFSEYQNSNDFINTGKMFQIPYHASANYDPDFLKQTLFYSNQVDVSRVQNIIKNETDKYFLNCNVESIIKFFENWHSEYFENKMALEKEDIRSFMLETMLSNNIPEPKMTEFPKGSIWNEVASQFQFVFVKKEDNLTKIWQAVNLQMCNCFDDQSTDLLKWNEPLDQPSIKVNKIKQYFQKIKPPIRKDKSSYNIKDLYLLLWQVCELPLILNINVNIDSQKDIYVALSKLNSSKSNRRYIFLGEVTSDFDQYSTHFNFLRINRDIQEKVLKNVYVSLQGKEAVTLEELKPSDAVLEKISPELLIELLQPITKKVEAGPVYISRSIRQPIVSINVLLIPKVVFVILTGDGPINFQRLNKFGIILTWNLYKIIANKSITINIKENFDTDRMKIIIFHKDTISLKECKHFENIINKVRKCEEQTVHYLRYLDENKLEWLLSNKNAGQVKPFLISSSKDYVPDLRLFHYLTFNILSGNAGEGKSTLLQFLSNHSPKDVWVINLNMGEIAKYIEKGEFSDIKTFVHHQSNGHFKGFDEFSWELFQILHEEFNVLIIIDGIDEIEYNSKTETFLEAIRSLGIKTIIVTRPSLRDFLEEKFHMLSLFLEPFTVEDCRSLINRTFQNNTLKEVHINEVLQKIYVWDNVVGVPLLLKLFVSIVSDANISYFNEFDISDLFDTYISQQLIKVDSCNKSTLRTLSRLALFVLYKEDAISKLIPIEEYFDDVEDKIKIFLKSKLVEKFYNNKIPVFAHKSIAEFLVARFLLQLAEKPINDIQQKVLKSLFYKELETVRIFFDIITLKGSVLQGIITGNNHTVLCHKINKNLVDKFGRHGLHIAASYGNKCELRILQSFWSGVIIYEPYNNIFVNNVIELCQKFERRNAVPLNFVCELLQKGLDPFQKDSLFEMDVFEFAIESGSLEIIEALFSKQFIKQLENINVDVLLCHVVRNGYVNVFREIKITNFKLKVLPALDNLLHIALSSENIEIIKELTNGAIPIDEQNNFGYTPLISWLTSSKLVNSNEYLLSTVMNRNSPLNENQLNILNHLIDKKVNLNAVNGSGETPLHAFCGYQEESIVELIIRNGAEINRKTNLGDLPLHYASQHSLENVKLLVKHNSIIDISNSIGYTPLCYAVKSNKLDIIKYLKKKGATVNRNKKEPSPLNIAVSKGYVECAKLLIEKGAKINNNNCLKNNTILWTYASGDLSCIKLLLQNGAKFNEWLLGMAMITNHQHIVKFLLSKKLLVSKNINLNKLIYQAVGANDTDLFDLLISYGADIHTKSEENNGDTPLHLACLLGSEKIVEHLSKHKSLVNVENNTGQTPVFRAAESGNFEVLYILVNNGSDLSKYGSDALYIASRNGYNDVVDYLILAGAEVNGTNSMGCAPIHHASESNLNCVEHLKRKGADINLKTVNEGITPLMLAATKGLLDIVEYLTANGVNVNEECNSRLYTALIFASVKGHLECVKFLIDEGSDLCKYGPLAIYSAACGEHDAIIDHLISAGADINGIIDNNSAPIHVAIPHNNLKAVKYLLKKGADPKSLPTGNTLLMLAAYKGHKEVAQYLVENGAQIDAKNTDRHTALTLACQEGHLPCVKFFINNVYDVHRYGHLALYIAIRNSQTAIAEFLISVGAHINGFIDGDKAAIHIAATNDELKVVKNLLHKGANINSKTRSTNSTPLILAAYKGYIDIVEHLAEHGAELDEENLNCRTALIFASQEGHLECVKFLIDKGSNVSKYGQFAIYIAAARRHIAVVDYLISAVLQGDLDVVKCLTEKGADINLKTRSESCTPLMLAAFGGYREIVEYLTENGASLNERNTDEQSALTLASEGGYLECVRYLIDKGAH